MRNSVLIIAALAASGLSSGCVATAVGAAAGVGMFAVQDRSIGEGIDDSSATARIQTRLLAADSTGFASVQVRVSERNVLLTGAAPSEQHKQTAEMIARSMPDVRNIYNEISVGPARGLGRGVTDQWIATQIRTRLNASPNVRGINVGVEAYDGNVYLTGLARSDSELQRAAEIASTTSGVRRVVSFMQVRTPQTSTYAQYQPPAPEFRGETAAESGAPVSANSGY